MRKILTYGIICGGLIGATRITSGQTAITQPVINRYAPVTAIGIKEVTVESASYLDHFHNHDTVLLIQMTGIDEDGNNPNNAGRYEFYIIEEVKQAESKVVLTTAVKDIDPGNIPAYDPTSQSVQLVRVPAYRNAQVNAVLGCDPWNGKTGGVLALMVEETLTLNADIDVTALGFRGGGASGFYGGACSDLPPYTDKNYVNSASDRAGFKGEGSVTNVLLPTMRGKGPAWNGGGGGNGKFAGGGGGGNGGRGGQGDIQVCGLPGTTDNNGGLQIKYFESDNRWLQRAFMGGGGGSGTGANTPGGAGGGIVIIAAKNLQLNEGAAIKSNGGEVTATVKADEGGAGGGGAGGSILLSVEQYDSFRAEILGGKGGDVTDAVCSSGGSGAGGGGAGGLVYVSTDKDEFIAAFDSDIQRKDDDNYGRVNNGLCDVQTTAGDPGDILGGLELPIRGFLYNFITTQDTTLCYGEQKMIKASMPQGGGGVYDYIWQYSADGGNTWTPIANSNVQNYAIQTNTVTASYRRVVSSSEIIEGTPVLTTDISVPVIVTVIPEIKNTLVFAADTTICGNITSMFIEGSAPTGGNGTYTYQWQRGVGNPVAWSNINHAEEKDVTVSLSPGNFYYRREVISQGCTVISDPTEVRVLSVIVGNTIQRDQNLCEGQNAEELYCNTLSGGDGTYAYVWQTGDNNVSWVNISGATADDYTPNLQYIGNRYYRRIVTSGAATSGSYDCCADTSLSVVIHYDQHPSPASAGADQTLNFKFETTVEAVPVAVGTGLWTVAVGSQTIVDPDQAYTAITNMKIGTNTLEWTVSNGVCPSVSDRVDIEVRDITIPSGFSPNNDNINDCFRVLGAENAERSELIIFNRYNNVVYRSSTFKGSSDESDCSGWWDGSNSSGKELPSGTYFYQLTLNGNKVYKGYVVLKK